MKLIMSHFKANYSNEVATRSLIHFQKLTRDNKTKTKIYIHFDKNAWHFQLHAYKIIHFYKTRNT